MEYFIMKTDKRLRRLPQIQLSPTFFVNESAKTEIAYVKEYGGLNIEYADYLQQPVRLISHKFQAILQKYQPDMVFHRVMLIEQSTGKQRSYDAVFPPEIVCAYKEEVKDDTNRQLQNFILDVEKIGKNKIFLAQDFQKELLVRLDVAESILRREANGIWFEPVKAVGRSKWDVR